MGRLTRCCEKKNKEISCYVKSAGIRLYTIEELSNGVEHLTSA